MLTSPKYFLAKAALDTLAASGEPEGKVYFVFKSVIYLFFISSLGHLTKSDFGKGVGIPTGCANFF